MFRQVYAACAALTVFGSVAVGQIGVTSVGGPPFVEAWVDPCNGNDLLGAVNCSNAPFRTIGLAIQALQFSGLVGPGSPGLVHCDAGIYATSTNGESFPIRMQNWIHVQGVGARQCVIRGEGLSPPMNVFFPTNGHNCECGSYGDAEVLVDLSFLYDQSEEMIDGLTFQGGDIQMYFRGEATCYARVSNCVFDMLMGDRTVVKYDDSAPGGVSSAPLAGPLFGMLIVHDYHPGVPYYDTPINILNNSFIMAWLPNVNQAVLARAGAVAICDVTNPLCNVVPPEQPDPNPALRGWGPLSIQNNLIRTAPLQSATALLGIDASTVTARIGIPVGLTNAFDPARVGGKNSTGVYCSAINTRFGGQPPRPRVNINPTTAGGRDAAVIGEMLTRQFGQSLNVSRDWRLLPSSALVDAGSTPRPLSAGGILAARNGTTYTEPALVPLSSFDLDGEVYGNPRVQPAFGSPNLLVDIGFDETHLMVDCAGWANDSVSHRWNPAVTPEICGPINQGQALRGLVFPVAGNFTLFETRTSIPIPFLTPCAFGAAFYNAYTTMWGTVVPPGTLPGFAAFYDQLWMSSALVTTGPSGTATPVAYTAPNDPTILNFAAGFAPTVGATPWQFVNEQSFFIPTGGARFLSNLQSSTD